ncbi:ADP-ribosylglycohydrolase family protein [Actinomycetaceae bacterium L2_0104]
MAKMRSIQHDRALAALQGLALGDALGMPTQSMSPQDIGHHYGTIDGLRDAVPAQQIAPSMPAGSITDDTEQALLLAHLLIDGAGHIEAMSLATALLDWERDMIARGSHDLLGPSTKAALEKVRAGADPTTTGRFGTTNGASMRVAPVGIAFGLDDPAGFARAVHESCMVTHDTHQGWHAAALVAAAVSAGVSGEGTAGAIGRAVDVVADLPVRGYWSAKASVLQRTRHELEQTAHLHGQDLLRYLREVVGTSVDSTESVPAAFIIAREFAERPMEGLCAAANLGGDTDTIGAMAGAVLGATNGTCGLPEDDVRTVCHVSRLDLETTAESLLDLRKQ